MKNITDNQKKLLIAFSKNDYVMDYGWRNEFASAWTLDLADDMIREGVKPRSTGGIIAKASESGLISITQDDDEAYAKLTDLGRSELEKLLK